MRPWYFPACLVGLFLAGCGSSLHNEERVVELPAGLTLSAAALAGQRIIAGGFFSEVQKHYPDLNQQQFQGLYLSWKTRVSGGQEKACYLTGIRYRGSLPEAKAIADFCESLVKDGVSAQVAEGALTPTTP